MRCARHADDAPPLPRDPEEASPAPAIVVFSGESSIPALRWLRPGYRHCFVLVEKSGIWVACDPLAHRTDLVIIGAQDQADLVAWYRRKGFVAVKTETRRAPPRLAPIRPLTCVEMVKRILGIHAPNVWTPWQLHRHLTAEK